VDDTREVLIECYQILSLAHELFHGVADVYFVGEYDETLHGAIPMRFGIVFVGKPWEYPIAVSQKEAFGGQVSANGEETIWFSVSRVGEP
jgi:hypothetical protein